MKFGKTKRFIYLLAVGVAVVLGGVLPARAQQSMITVDGDVRLFTVLSALQAAGYPFPPAASSTVSEARREVSQALQRELPEDLRARLKQFYEAHREGEDRSKDLSRYISFAMSLDQPPKLGFVWTQDKLPPDVLPIADFQPLVKEFYDTVHIERIWSRIQSPLNAYIAAQQAPIMQTIQQTEGYLRLPSFSYLGRHYYIVVDMMGANTTPTARNYGEDYYLVVSPSEKSSLVEIRHQFLHFVLDPLSLRVADRFYHKRELLSLAVNNPNLDPQFKKDFMLFAVECLIRAVELRLRHLPAAKADDEITLSAASGFFLIRHFYDQLVVFEKQDEGIREALGDMVESIDMDAERKYVASLALVKLPPPSTAPKVERSPGEIKLDAAENMLSEEKYELAKKAFKEIAQSDPTLRSRALYGLGVACSLQRNTDEAKTYFEQALAEKNADGATKVWSHIYLGRLYDLAGEREDALREYAAAVQTGDDFRGAQAAAKRGLEKPFGVKARPKK